MSNVSDTNGTPITPTLAEGTQELIEVSETLPGTPVPRGPEAGTPRTEDALSGKTPMASPSSEPSLVQGSNGDTPKLPPSPSPTAQPLDLSGADPPALPAPAPTTEPGALVQVVAGADVKQSSTALSEARGRRTRQHRQMQLQASQRVRFRRTRPLARRDLQRNRQAQLSPMHSLHTEMGRIGRLLQATCVCV